MKNSDFIPQHVNISRADLEGNNGIGRYLFLPGSDGRAKQIGGRFDDLIVKSHPRGHNLYSGTLEYQGHKIDVGAIATGIGCASAEIILHELFHLGAKRFLRVGTAGSLQPFVKVGDLINAQAAVRDEHTTTDYMPIGVPAVASYEYTTAILAAAKQLGLTDKLHSGTVHCKSSLYARELGAGPKSKVNKAYINLLSHCGVLASEMETAAFFVLSQLYNYELMQQGIGHQHRVLVGALLDIVDMSTEVVVDKELIELAIETIKVLAISELNSNR